MEKHLKVLDIDDSNLYDQGLLRSQRKFKQIRVEMTFSAANLNRLAVILELFGEKCQHLSLSSLDLNEISDDSTVATIKVQIDAEHLVSMLKLVPTLKSLTFDIEHATFVRWAGHREKLLPQLETLTFSHFSADSMDYSKDFAAMFSPNTLKELNIQVTWKHLGTLLKSQASLKRLEIADVALGRQTQLNHLELESVLFHQTEFESERSDQAAIDLLASQKETFKSFKLTSNWKGYATSRNLLRAIFAKKGLERICISIGDDNLDEIGGLAQMETLKELEVETQGINEGILELAIIPLANLECLIIEEHTEPEDGTFIDGAFMALAGSNWSKLKHLTIINTEAFHNGIDNLNDVLDNFPLLETLKIKYEYDDIEDLRCMLGFYLGRRLYPKLQSLKLKHVDIINFRDMLTAMPNLKVLKVKCYEREIEYAPALIYQLAKLKSLRELKLPLIVDISSYRFGEFDAAMLKRLCRHLQTFMITIKSSHEFAATLRQRLINSDHLIDVTIEAVEGRSMTTLKQAIY